MTTATPRTAQVLPIKAAPALRAHPLVERARRNYPESAYLQREWLRAVGVVRASSRGWLLDGQVRAK